jgi:hypothetical protein
MVQDKIYEYFERNPWLKVLFIFNDGVLVNYVNFGDVVTKL